LEETIFRGDFLDSIGSDRPKGTWSIQSDSSKTEVTLRSMLWPGFIAYHRANSGIFGYCYMGNGIKNEDLPFLL
jgi:radial spoke head protein 9